MKLHESPKLNLGPFTSKSPLGVQELDRAVGALLSRHLSALLQGKGTVWLRVIAFGE